MWGNYGYKGVGGARYREDDEGWGNNASYKDLGTPQTRQMASQYRAPKPTGVIPGNVHMVAKYPGKCIVTGQPIAPGDTVSYNPNTKTRTLIKKAGT